MAAVDFFHRGRKSFLVAHFNHRTEFASIAQKCVEDWCSQNSVRCEVGFLEKTKPSSVSKEEFWRNERYAFLKKFGLPIVTAHNLDDAVETWIFSCLNGRGKLIPARNKDLGILRPFLAVEKEELLRWCLRKGVPFVEDPSNKNLDHPRNRIRHVLVPECLKVNPGLKKVVRKMYLAERCL